MGALGTEPILPVSVNHECQVKYGDMLIMKSKFVFILCVMLDSWLGVCANSRVLHGSSCRDKIEKFPWEISHGLCSRKTLCLFSVFVVTWLFDL